VVKKKDVLPAQHFPMCDKINPRTTKRWRNGDKINEKDAMFHTV
jgi:hypothetical protein